VTEAKEDVCEALEEGEIETFHSSSSATPGVKTATFYQWKYSHYFTVVEDSEGAKNIHAQCKLYSPSSKPLSCARNTTLNYKKKHLDTVHKTTKLEAIIPEALQDRKRKRKRKTDDEQKQSDSKRQCTLVPKTSVSPEL